MPTSLDTVVTVPLVIAPPVIVLLVVSHTESKAFGAKEEAVIDESFKE